MPASAPSGRAPFTSFNSATRARAARRREARPGGRVRRRAALGGVLRGRGGVAADDERVQRRSRPPRELLPRAQRRQRRLLELALRLLCDYQDGCHQITLASSCSFCTSVGTSGTLMPAAREGGDSTLITLTLGETSTPSACGVSSSIGFF